MRDIGHTAKLSVLHAIPSPQLGVQEPQQMPSFCLLRMQESPLRPPREPSSESTRPHQVQIAESKAQREAEACGRTVPSDRKTGMESPS